MTKEHWKVLTVGACLLAFCGVLGLISRVTGNDFRAPHPLPVLYTVDPTLVLISVSGAVLSYVVVRALGGTR